VTTPNGGESIEGLATIRWTYQGQEWQPEDTVYLDYSRNAGWDWIPITNGNRVRVINQQFAWDTSQAVPNYGTQFLLRITSNVGVGEPLVSDISDELFALHNQPLSFYINDNDTTGDVFTSAPGNDNNDGGSPASPMATLEALLYRWDLEAGDVVYVDTGHYQHPNTVSITASDSGNASGYVTLQGSPHGATLEGQRSYVLDINADYVHIEGLRFTGIGGIRTEHASANSNIMITNNEFLGRNYALDLDSSHSKTAYEISNNLFVNNSRGIDVSFFGSNCQTVIRNNTIIGSGSDVGIYIYHSKKIAITNNIFSMSGNSAYAYEFLFGDLPEGTGFSSDYNDFHLSISNSTSAWMHGCCGNNGTLLGIGERAGNTPIEGLLFQLLQLKENMQVDTKVVKEIAEYYMKIGYSVPEFYPLVGKNFNVTRAGVHADGLIKNPEIYTSFDYDLVLGKTLKSVVGRYSGASGVAWRVNDLLGFQKKDWLSKEHPGIMLIHEEVSNQYSMGRITAFSDAEIERLVERYLTKYWEKVNGKINSRTVNTMLKSRVKLIAGK